MRIGVTGKNCSGKDTVAELLVEKGFYHHSLSDIIRDELSARGLDATRDNLIQVGNELRESNGASILAQRTEAKLESDRNYVITSIRNPGEVDLLRRSPKFLLISVEAPMSARYERSVGRDRVGEGQLSVEEFTANEAREQSSNPKQQQLDKVGELADLTICNNGTLEQLQAKLDETLQEVLRRMPPQRPSWDEYFMRIAIEVSSRSNCIKRKVAAIVVKDKRIISTGYNGTPRGTTNCDEGGCPRCNSFAASGTALDECTCSHAEENSIVQAAYHGVCVKDSSIYTTFSPCLMCAKMIINSGIREVIFNAEYSLNNSASALLVEAGVVLRQHKL